MVEVGSIFAGSYTILSPLLHMFKFFHNKNVLKKWRGQMPGKKGKENIF